MSDGVTTRDGRAKRAAALRRARILALLLLAAHGGPLPAAQESSDKLQELQRDLQQQRQLREQQNATVEQLRREIASLDAQQREALGRIEEVGASIARTDSEIRALQEDIRQAEALIADLEGTIQVTTARVERLQAEVRLLMRNLYKERNARFLQLLSQARTLPDLMIRARYANSLGEQNVRMVSALRDETERLNVQRQQQLDVKARLEANEQELQVKVSALRDAQAQQRTMLSELQASAEGRRALALQTQAQARTTAESIDGLLAGIVQERARLEQVRREREEAERRRRAEEARRLREEQERLRREQERLAAIERERQAALQREQERQAAIRREQERQAAVRREQERQAVLTRQREAEARVRAEREQQERAARAAAEARERVEREQQAVQARQDQLDRQEQEARVPAPALPASAGRLSFPLAGGRVSVPYGAEGQYQVLRSGVGAAVLAAADGDVVAESAYANEGWIVIVAHTPTLFTVYSGLQQPSVATGARVARGQVLGFVGGSPLLGPDGMKFQVVTVGPGGDRRYVAPDY